MSILSAVVGGIILGFATLMFLFGMGRVVGLSGFMHQSIRGNPGTGYWRLGFLAGLFIVGLIDVWHGIWGGAPCVANGRSR